MDRIGKGSTGGKAIFMEPWEFDFLRSGQEPDSRHLFLFSVIYETGDWQKRWEAAAERIVQEWRMMPLEERPAHWIRYLVAIGYLPKKVMDDLSGDFPPLAVSA